MLVSAVLVDIMFRKEIEKSSRVEMKLHVYTLLAVTEHNNSLTLPALLPNPEFNRLDSGLIAWVLNEEAQVIFKEQAPWATIAHSVVYMTMRPEVEGYVVHPLGGHIFNQVGLSN